MSLPNANIVASELNKTSAQHTAEQELIYALPKTYNGKTVTDLFPEFQHNKVLRFSKLLGFGRVTSLPKTWKGTRKRKKQKGEPNGDQFEAKSALQSIPEETKTTTTPTDEDVFKLFDEGFTDKKNLDESQTSQAEESVEQDELEYEADDEIDFLKPYLIDDVNNTDERKTNRSSDSPTNSSSAKAKTWLSGPASYWYQDGDVYAELAGKKAEKIKQQKKKKDEDEEEEEEEEEIKESQEDECETVDLSSRIKELNASIKEDAFLLVNTTNWEENIIYDLNQTHISANGLVNERIKFAGWIPSTEHRTLSSFQSKILGKKVDFVNQYKDQAVPNIAGSKQPAPSQTLSGLTNWNSIFPNENFDLVYGDWEKKIILDTEKLDLDKLAPAEFSLDLNDDNLVLGIPEETSGAVDEGSSKAKENETGGEKAMKARVYENRAKLSKSILGKSGRELDQTVQEETNDQTNEQASEASKNFWNVSNDDYYNPKAVADTQQANTKNVSAALVIQHTLPAIELHESFFPTHLSNQKLRNFHRYGLKRHLNGTADNVFCPVFCLIKRSEMVAIKTANDLSASDSCEIVLAEYSEQFPPLMSQTGMASKIRNYYKRKFGKDDGPVKSIDYGEMVYINSSPFLGSLKPGEYLQSIENYMFRAPIYKHKLSEQDFLVVRNRNQSSYLIRSDVKCMFTVGQECPLIEVPGPNSKRANSFLKDFLQACLFKMFHESKETPKRIRMEDVKRAFPTQAESSIRKRLKLYADFRRTGKMDANWWLLKDDIRLPSEEEIRAMVTAEQCCAYYSMLAAEQRLKDAGYGEKNLFASDDDDVDNAKIDDEVKNAPWHTTRAYIDAIKGKCLLQVNGAADPTGRGEGFSYVRQPFKPKQDEEAGANATAAAAAEKPANVSESVSSPQPQPKEAAKRTVTGTDADLRRLHLSQAKELLASYGVPDHEIKKLKRWEIIDVVRTMSTQKAKEGNGSAVSKFARGNRYSQSDAHEKFREECQRLFELQNRNLASEEFLSTDDDEELDEDSDVDEMGKNLESMLSHKMTSSAMAESKTPGSAKPNDKSSELKNLIMNNTPTDKLDNKKQAEAAPTNPNMNRILKIMRTYRDENGEEFTKTEVVKKQLIIDAYVKIRSTRDDEFIRTAFALDESEKEQLRKEKRRIQEQLRRFKRNEAKKATADVNESPDGKPAKPVRKYNKTGLNRKPKQPKSGKNADNVGAMGANENTNQSLMSSPDNASLGLKKLANKSSLHYSSGDEDRMMSHGGLGEDLSQSNQLDTTASSLNNTLTGGGSSTAPKRKYVKKKKPEQLAEASASISKVEGTKLIIKKKAIKMGDQIEQKNNDSMDSVSIESSPVKKKYKTKKMKLLELQESMKSSSELMVVDTNDSTNPADPNTPQAAPKIKIINKSAKSSIVLHIPKEKLGLTPGESASMDNSGANSPSIDITSINDSVNASSLLANQTSQQQAQRRQYNKQNSLIKKQQKMEQQQFQQLQQQLSQSPLVNQFANLLEQQQLIMALAQQQQQLNMIQSNPLSAAGLVFPQLLNKQISMQAQQQQQQQQQQIKRKNSNQPQLDYLIKPHKKVDRRHADPAVSLATLLESLLNELREMQEAQPFLLPVNSKKVPDYYNVVKNPLDLQSIRKRVNEKFYKERSLFLSDMQILIDNSALYNGPNHTITSSAEKLYSICVEHFEQHSDKFLRLEKAINPLLDDNSLHAFNYLLNRIYDENIMPIENSFSFLKPVSKQKYKDYYDIIKNPIDLETIKSKINSKNYKSRDEFVADFELLYNNCLTYNGLNNSYTNTAQRLLSACRSACQEDYANQMEPLEEEINNKIIINDEQQELTRNASSISVDALTDSESNLASNYQDNESMDDNPPIPVISMAKKLKAMNKNASNSGSSRPNTSASFSMQSGQSFKKKKGNLLLSNKNSPRSGSDAEVFVDVESIDDRGMSLIGGGKNRHGFMSGFEAGGNGGDMNAYDESDFNEYQFENDEQY